MGDFLSSDAGNYTCSQTNTSGTLVSDIILLRLTGDNIFLARHHSANCIMLYYAALLELT